MKFQYDRFTIEVTENNGVLKVIIKDKATGYKRKLRSVGSIRRSMGVWVWEVRQIGKGKATLWLAKSGAAAYKQTAIERVNAYIKENIERGHADPNKPAVSIEEEKSSGEPDIL